VISPRPWLYSEYLVKNPFLPILAGLLVQLELLGVRKVGDTPSGRASLAKVPNILHFFLHPTPGPPGDPGQGALGDADNVLTPPPPGRYCTATPGKGLDHASRSIMNPGRPRKGT